MIECGYVYILASGFKHLYIGVTSELEERIWQHKNGAFPGSFTDKYNIKHLVSFERLGDMAGAIARVAAQTLVAHQEDSFDRGEQSGLA